MAFKYINNIILLFIFFIIIGLPFDVWAQKQKEATLDLRNYALTEQKAVALDTLWEFYYGAFLNAQQIDSLNFRNYLMVPSSSWSAKTYKDEEITGKGFATYRLKVFLNDNYPMLAFKTIDQSTAYRIFVNNQLIGELGQVGTTEETMIPAPDAGLFYFQPKSKVLDIVIHASNFHHRKGGIWNTIYLTTPEKANQMRIDNLLMVFFLTGSLWIMSIYHWFIYFIRKKEKSVFYFALLCFLVPIRLSLVEENYFLSIFPYLDWVNKYRLEYLSLFWILPLFFLFLDGVFPSKLLSWSGKIILGAVVFFSLIIVFTEADIFTYLVFPIYALNFISIFIILYTLIIAVLQKKAEAWIFLIGTIFLSVTTINDILHSSLVINTFYTIPLGFFVFFFSQAAALSIRFSKAFRQVEVLSTQLEIKVEERTEQLNDINTELAATIDQLQLQKRELEYKSEQVLSSISYALRIQQAILPDLQKLEYYFADAFVWLQPRDVVSGDFYYFAEKEDKIIIAVSDCTGHGVPGAFMSMIGNALLDKIIHDWETHEPAVILHELHREILRSLHKSSQAYHGDGMDIGIFCLDNKQQVLKYAGAHTPLLYFIDEEAHIIKGDKISIGSLEYAPKFSQHEIDLREVEKNLRLYLFSDGFQDQFGGVKNRKFGNAALQKLFKDIQHEPMQIQKRVLQNIHQEWIEQGNETQIDDVLILGVEIKKPMRDELS